MVLFERNEQVSQAALDRVDANSAQKRGCEYKFYTEVCHPRLSARCSR